MNEKRLLIIINNNKGERRRVAFLDILASPAPLSHVINKLYPAAFFLIALLRATGPVLSAS